MSALTRAINNRRDNPKPRGGKIYKAVNTTSIIGLFATMTIIVLMITKTIPWSSNVVGIIAAIAILCFSCILALPWIRKIENNEFKTLSYVFLGLVAASCILWIIADIVIISQYKSIKAAILAENLTEEENLEIISGLFRTLNFLKVTMFLTLQFSVASFIATTITRYRKTMIPFQAIAYASYAFVDFWVSGILFSFSINSNLKKFQDVGLDKAMDEIFHLNVDFVKFLTNKVVLTILFLAVVYVAISNAITKRQDNRKLRTILEDMTEDGNIRETKPVEDKPAEVVETIEDKLAKLKSMYEKELITKEEYEEKKSKLLEDM